MSESAGIAGRFGAAFGRRDVDALLGCFTEDATYRDLFYGEFAGRAALRGLFERMFHEGRDHEWVMEHVVAEAGRTIAEWRFAFVVADGVPRSAGRRLAFAGVSVFDTGADGRCHAYREYFDRGAALVALGVPPAALGRIIAGRPTVRMTPAC